jgi:hypothetical protein
MYKLQRARRSLKWRRVAGSALAGILVLAGTQAAKAFTYGSGDLVGIFVDGNSELIVNLGPIASLTPGTFFDFQTPPGFGADGSTGGKFLAVATEPPFSGSLGRNVAFTAAYGVDPSSYDSNITAYVARIGLAQSALDDGGAADKYLELLNNFPLPPTGGVITNVADELALLTSNPASYTSTIGLNGTSDRIDNQLPFEIDIAVTGDNLVLLWDVERVATTLADTVAIGLFRVEGNVGGGTPTTRITYLPEPGTPMLLGYGVAALGGLSGIRRRRSRPALGASC